MRKVLIIVERFPATGGSRIDNFVKYLSSFGWCPIILTTKFNDNSYGRKLLKDVFPNSLRIVRAFSLVKTPFRVLSKYFGLYETTAVLERLVFIPDPAITWVLPAMFKGLKLLKTQNIDVILSSSPSESAHVIGFVLSRLSGKKWVTDFRDLWTHYKARYRPPTAIHDKIIRQLEKFIFRETDHIIANTEENRKIYIKSLNVPKDKISVITNGYDPGDLRKIVPLRSADKESHFRIAYMGYFDKHFLPWRQFLITLNKLIRSKIEPKLRFNIYGYVSKKAIYSVDTYNLQNYVRFHGEYPHSEAIKLTAKNDLLLLLLHEDDTSQAIVPLKLYSYLMMNKPILAIAPKVGAVARIIEKTHVGSTISLNEDGRLFTALKEYYEMWVTNGEIAFARNVDEIKKYNAKSLTKRLSELFEETLGTRHFGTKN